MRVEEIALRQEIRQMISEAGINKNTIQEMAEQIFKKVYKVIAWMPLPKPY